MPRYFLHLNECGSVTEDPDGVELLNLAEVRAAAMKAAREIMCAEIAEGRLCLGCQIDVADEVGFIILNLPFRDAVKITGQ